MVVENHRVVAGNAAAERLGVRAGTRIGNAHALAPGLAVRRRAPTLERQALDTLANWAGAITPELSLEPPALLLEVGACLRLFGGLDAILRHAVEGIGGLGFTVHAGVAPTPLAALWRSRAGLTEPWLDRTRPAAALDALPLEVLQCSLREAAALAAWGVRSLGDVLRLPRAGLARRLGTPFVLRLAQALGECPDPRPRVVFPERFEQRIEFLVPVEHATAILFGARRLVGALGGWLHRRAAGVRELNLILEGERGPHATLPLRFAETLRDAGRIERVLRERLERHALEDRVAALRIAAARVEALPGAALPLFDTRAATAGPAEVIERVRARLGDDGVVGLVTRADHRPECASGAGAVGAAAAPPPAAPRPVWLLAEPQSLHEVRGAPWLDGPLSLRGGPERIASGWWTTGEDAVGDLRRDYFVACAASGQWLWIFRDRTGWWLHGHFG